MPQYVIERDLPGAGRLTSEELTAISQKSCDVLDGLATPVKWLHSYVTDDRIYCVYDAPDEASIQEHGRQGGFPVTRVSEVRSTISPATAKR